MKIPSLATLGVLALLLAGCSNGIAGQASALPNQPIDAETATLRPIVTLISDRILNVSPDGRTAIVESDDFGICAVSVDSAKIDAGRCAGVEESAPRGIAAAEFNADGTKVVVRQDFVRDFRGGAWIFEVDTGDVTPIQFADGPVGEGSGFFGLAWNLQRGEIIGLTYRLVDGEPVQEIVRVDPVTAIAQLVGDPLDADESANGQLATASNSLVYSAYQASEKGAGLVRVDLTGGERTDLGTFGSQGELQNLLLSISGDGEKVLIQQVDQAKFEVKGILEVDLGSGDSRRWPGSEGLQVAAAVYSPDGSQVLVVGRNQDRDSSIVLFDQSGSELRDFGVVAGSIGPQSRLQWSGKNVITVNRPSNLDFADPVGWQLVR